MEIFSKPFNCVLIDRRHCLPQVKCRKTALRVVDFRDFWTESGLNLQSILIRDFIVRIQSRYTFAPISFHMKYSPLDPDIFIQNRKRFIGQLEKNSIAIFNSNDELPMNGDAVYKFKQNSDLFWLTGIVQED